MFALKKNLVALVTGGLFVAVTTPLFVYAFPFGGQITLYHVCYNETIFARLSGPVAGDYVWTTATRTYQFGPPRGAGQWLLGLTGIPFDCLWSVNPIFPVPAIAIAMMGSSQIGFSGASSGGYTPDPTLQPPRPTPLPTPTPSPQPDPGKTGVGLVRITEVLASVDGAHGSDPTHEWVELYNSGSAIVDLSGWTIQNASSSDTLPSSTTIGAGSFMLITASSTLKNFWTIPSGVKVVVLGGPIGNGLKSAGDIVHIKNASGASVDAVSWGTNETAFNPSAPEVANGRSLSRKSVLSDTNTASDWADKVTPTPGL